MVPLMLHRLGVPVDKHQIFFVHGFRGGGRHRRAIQVAFQGPFLFLVQAVFLAMLIQLFCVLYKALVSEEIHPPLVGRTFPGVAKMFALYFVGGQQSSAVLAFSFGATHIIGLVLGQGFFPVVGLERGVILEAGWSEEQTMAFGAR